MSPMKPLRQKMMYQMQRERLAPKTQEASVAAVAGLATSSGCSPDQLRPEQLRPSRHPLLVARQLAWSACQQVAWGLRFFSPKTLGWAPSNATSRLAPGAHSCPMACALKHSSASS